MFSERFNWEDSPTLFGKLLAEKRASGKPIMDLTESNPTRVGFHFEADAILSALSRPESLRYDSDPRGTPCARQAVTEYYKPLGQRIDPDAVLLTAGTSEAYGFLFKLLSNPGDEILVPAPGYPLLSYLARFEGLYCHSYPLRYADDSGWSIDVEVLSALITPQSRAIIIVNPNNPTGSYIKTDELAQIDSLCRRHNMALIVDEVFSDFEAVSVPGREKTVVTKTNALTFVLNGISKTLGLPQMKLAWIIVGGDPHLANLAIDRLEALLDFYLSVSTPVQHGLKRLLAGRFAIQQQINARIIENSRFLKNQTDQTRNCRMLIREGGWYGIMEIRDGVLDDARALLMLEKEDTLIHPGFFYDFSRDGMVVLSLLPEPANFSQGVGRLLNRFAMSKG
ncbi:MAG: pyridoxal phosphate-dependent aminotransferase [Desulfobacterales bacterium]|jgi:aspartate/methionine/tyrosine aminotransferase|nr:pyridoxal phosphate-dependent aminotransferase [Desulfobacterales bacterium]